MQLVAGTILDIVGGGRGFDAAFGVSGGGGGGSFIFAQALAPTVVPEPGSLAVLMTELLAMATVRRSAKLRGTR